MGCLILAREIWDGTVEVNGDTFPSELSLKQGSIPWAEPQARDFEYSSRSIASLRSSALRATTKEEYDTSPIKKATTPRTYQYHIIKSLPFVLMPIFS